MSSLSSAVHSAVDSICAMGCERVNACIEALQDGDSWPEFAALDAVQRGELLAELRSIMSIYTRE